MRLVPHSMTMEIQQKELLKRLAKRFRRAQNDLIREAIDLLGKKYEKKKEVKDERATC